MTPNDDTHPVAPLELGQGKTVLEMFLEPTCPHSKRAFEKIEPLLAAVGEDRLTIKIRLHSQPWHLFSPVVTRSILAASATEGGKETALRAMAGVYRNRDDFEFENHCSGANMTRTPTDILNAISALAGVDLTQAFCFRSVDHALRWHTRYSRQNGIHVSPTFAINGMVEPAMQSSQTVEEWTALLRPHLHP